MLITDLGDSDNPIPLPNVSSQVLKKVLEWCTHHKKDPEPVADDNEETRKKTTEISDWDQKCKSINHTRLIDRSNGVRARGSGLGPS